MTWGEFRARAARSGVAVPEGEPTPELLHALAPELGVRVPDVPEELNPLDETAGSAAAYLMGRFRGLPEARRTSFLQYARSLPQEPRTAHRTCRLPPADGWDGG
ncbi:hypothetical protein [Streptomyces sp. 4F14]|uniref:hypothetical protein n=1 Tax=Streptomyces sp. 4F14 TaxID=3394380 RepID=UPI003A8C380C